jgi:hypothetical protein
MACAAPNTMLHFCTPRVRFSYSRVSGGRTLVAAAVTLALLGSAPAWAEDSPRDKGDPQAAGQKKDTEFSIVPFVGGNSDMGFGGGYIAAFAGLEQGLEPYRYRIESAGTITFSEGDGGGVEVPYIDTYLLFSFPHLIKNHLGLDLRISYTRESTLKYYGLGNASRIPDGADANADYFEHMRVHPTAEANFEYRLRPLVVSWGVSYTQNWFEVAPGSRLDQDQRGPDPYLRDVLGDSRPHGALDVSLGVAWDTRDDETSPTRGIYLSERADVTPGTFGEASYRYARLDSAARFYVPIVPKDRRLILALRFVSDLLIGEPPFYELPRFDDTSAIGGAKGVRGVPAQRYYGKIKAFANFELRSELFGVHLLGEERRFGLAAFTDVGRLWADYRSNPELDGSGVGLKYGIGGGLRVASGKTFVLRVDVAWSPDANPVSAYLLGGHLF